ncbi:MAG: RNA polymerase subunit sigma-70 [Alphaproteobacteria bacterium]|nr:RNA polymerase subunit sigma-70 [Alphaproteobacteria bacterium]
MSDAASRAAEAAARASYGRLVALLAARGRDIAAAEDALHDAFAAALRVWPARGVPEKPEAWLLIAARRELGHRARAGAVRAAAAAHVEMLHAELHARESDIYPDARLKLLFVCAHPAIDPAVRTPLMLQTVLGLDAERIAAAFLVEPAAMAQRLVRAKAKIRDAGLAFEIPDPASWPERLNDVLAAVYAAYTAGWDARADGGGALTEEAIFLARLVHDLLPEDPEPKGLLALLLYCEARTPARRDAAGRFIPLSRQDPLLWRRDDIIEAETLLTVAARKGVFGRFQCEAAIQSVHCQRALTGVTDWSAVLALYDLLAARAPSLGGAIAQAAALIEAGRAAEALQALDALPPARVARHQPFWVVRAAALRALGDHAAAREATEHALALTTDPAVRVFLNSA